MKDFGSKVVTFQNVICKRESPKALLCEINGDDVWIPLSQIDLESEVKSEDDEGDLIISEWIAQEKGLV